ncbi:MAG: sigma-54-dependent Fis family transcriptional regulator [Clostridia bacterium]|nr:sigma-54-dependent Fis family transcriptional regulator [Clostridia bacterium]
MSKALKLLVVDDEPEFRTLLKIILKKRGYDVDLAEDGQSAIALINEKRYDIVLTDMMMNGLNGLDVLKHIKEKHMDTECIIITAHASVENAVDAMKEGAFSYFIKSNNPEELIFDIKKIHKIRELSDENQRLKKHSKFNDFVLKTKSPKFEKTLALVEKVAGMDSNVLILGESGVGKEVLARYIHNCSQRCDQVFMPVNCYSFSESLLESELYGHEKGAFTGSKELRKGRFEAAANGTLFLDEVGDIPMATQTKILRNIENKEIERIGSNKTIHTDFRLITATNKNLQQEIMDKRFRQDLFYRISTVIIEIPPLRERKEDLPMLLEHFFRKAQDDMGKAVNGISDDLMRVLLNYDYPGNIRELKNIIERLVVLAGDETLTYEAIEHYSVFESNQMSANMMSLKSVRADAEKKHIRMVLQENEFDMDESARVLEISSRQLYNKVKEYEIHLK